MCIVFAHLKHAFRSKISMFSKLFFAQASTFWVAGIFLFSETHFIFVVFRGPTRLWPPSRNKENLLYSSESETNRKKQNLLFNVTGKCTLQIRYKLLVFLRIFGGTVEFRYIMLRLSTGQILFVFPHFALSFAQNSHI